MVRPSFQLKIMVNKLAT
uniref:Uncharacterized protein n=1 Tax=Rhizophora mucronata TaxID=61149 RepID=A0A2P2QNM6_RHIMU